jgi:hypothetical protein
MPHAPEEVGRLIANAPVCHRCPFRAEGDCGLTGRAVAEHAIAGHCPKGKFSIDTPIPRWVWHGMIGIAKAVTRIGRADSATIARRRAACKACPHATVTFGVLKTCGVCGCGLSAKTANASEFCPLPVPKWGPSP